MIANTIDTMQIHSRNWKFYRSSPSTMEQEKW